jgi:hypothetical protein
MADSYVTATGDGTAGPFSFSVLDYLDVAHIGVKVEGDEQTLTEHYTISGTDVTFTTGYEPASATVIKIYRATPRSKANRLVDFADGTVLHEGDLDTAALQNLYIAQEAFEESGNAVSYDASLGAYTASSLEIKNLAEPTTDSSAASRKYVTDTASFGVPGIPQQDNSTFDGSTTQRTLVGWTGVSQSMVLAALDGVVQIPGTDFSIAPSGDDSVLTIIGVTQGDLNGVKLNVQNFGVAKSSNTIDDGSVTEAKLATDAVTAIKIAANAVGASEIATGGVGYTQVAANAVNLTRIKKTGFTSNNNTGNSTFLKVASNTSDLSLGTLTAAEITDLNSTLNAKPISIFAAATGDVNLGNGSTNWKIVNLKNPTADQDAATRKYVDDAIAVIGTPGLIKLGSYSLNSNSSSFAIEGWFDAAYHSYEFECYNFTQYGDTGGAFIGYRLADSNGTYRSGSSDYKGYYTGSPYSSGGNARMGLATGTIDDDNKEEFKWNFRLWMPNNNTAFTDNKLVNSTGTGFFSYTGAGNFKAEITYSTYFKYDTNVVTKVRFHATDSKTDTSFSAGIRSGAKVIVYGRKF